MSRRKAPEINAGSMADIAFLLLIFFLVTTTMNVDMGIARKLPEKTDVKSDVIVKEKNVLDIVVNRNNQLLIENEIANISDVKKLAMKFIDNGGGIGVPSKDGKPGEPCDYCRGDKDPNSSDHPSKAVISLQSDRGTKYGMYISVQNAIEEAYDELRNKLSVRLYGRSLDDMEADYNNNPTESLKEKIDNIKDKYPQIISEPAPIK